MFTSLTLTGALLTAWFASMAGGRDSDAVSEAIPAPSREFRGVWVATVSNIDFPSRRDLTAEQQKAELLAILDRAARLNLNAVVFQVRPACDALYNSSLEPWSEYLTGAMGKPPEPFYDPLAFLVEEGHNRGLEVHAWFNPYRARHPSGKSALSDNHISVTRPELVREYGKHLWLDPGEAGTQDHSVDVILDVVRRYDIDGVHLDDYFYPYKERGADRKVIEFPDEASWQKYRAEGGRLKRDDWRRENVNRFIERLYRAVKKEKAWVKFGISPFGIWRPGYPEQIRGFDAYSELYADARKWLRNGWVDYFTPQIYFRSDQKAQSYPVLLEWWAGQNVKNRHLWPGMFTGMVGREGWTVKEIVEQIKTTRAPKMMSTGNIHFSERVFAANRLGLADALLKEVYAKRALVPASPWLSRRKPKAPSVRIEGGLNETGADLKWSLADPGEVRFWAVYTWDGSRWDWKLLPPSQTSLSWSANWPMAAAVSAIDRFGNESSRTRADFRTEQVKR